MTAPTKLLAHRALLFCQLALLAWLVASAIAAMAGTWSVPGELTGFLFVYVGIDVIDALVTTVRARMGAAPARGASRP